MCDPLTIISGIAMAGSTVASTGAQRQQDSARARAMQNDMIRQERLDSEAAALNTASQDRYKNFDDKQGAKAKSLGDYITGQTATSKAPPANAPTETMPTSASNIVTQEQAKQSGKAKAYTDQQGDALATMRSFGDLLGGIGMDQARDAGSLGQVNGFKKGWASVLPYELEAANQKGSGMKMLADVLGGLGSMGMQAGLGPSMAGGAAGAAGSIPRTAASMTMPVAQAPMRLNMPTAPLASFARTPSLFNPYAGA